MKMVSNGSRRSRLIHRSGGSATKFRLPMSLVTCTTRLMKSAILRIRSSRKLQLRQNRSRKRVARSLKTVAFVPPAHAGGSALFPGLNMYDVAIRLENRPGAMAEMGEALGGAGVSVEGGGGWVMDDKATMHFLFQD